MCFMVFNRLFGIAIVSSAVMQCLVGIAFLILCTDAADLAGDIGTELETIVVGVSFAQVQHYA